MMLKPFITATTFLASAFHLTPAAAQQAAQTMAELSSSACFAQVNGTLKMPDAQDIAGMKKALKPLGLGFGITPAMQKDMGPLGLTLISRAGLASKSVADGDLVMAYDGPLPGCRILLLSSSGADLAGSVEMALVASGWRNVPAPAAPRAGVQKRIFLRRGQDGSAYMLSQLALPEGSARLRLVTTVVRVPPNVTLPQGY